MPPRCRRDSAAVPPRCRRDSAAIPPRFRRDAAAIPPRCCRDSAAMPPWIAADPDFFQYYKIRRPLCYLNATITISSIQFRIDHQSSRIGIDRLNLVRDRSKIITDRYRQAQFSSGSIRNDHGSVSIGLNQFKIDQFDDAYFNQGQTIFRSLGSKFRLQWEGPKNIQAFLKIFRKILGRFEQF